MWYLVVSRLILFVFFTVMFFVTIVAHTRKSGNTGIDVAKIQLLRSGKTP